MYDSRILLCHFSTFSTLESWQSKNKEAQAHLKAAADMCRQLSMFSDGESFTEHSTASLRYLLIPAYQADLQSKVYPDVDDPERDLKRIASLEASRALLVQFLEDCLKLGMGSEEKINAEAFTQALGLSYQVVNIVSGDLNLAAAKKFDLEAWFPGQGNFRELVSCSNCLDYQSRRLDIKFGGKKQASDPTASDRTSYVHMLNSTLCATTRVICCILESYQVGDFETGGGIVVPEVLRKYMPDSYGDFLPFVKAPPDAEADEKKKGKGKGGGGKKKK